MLSMSIAEKFQNQLFKNYFRCNRRVSNILSVMIWIQTVWKGYQQMTKVATSEEGVTTLGYYRFNT